MGRQRNIPQMKEHENSPEEELISWRQAVYQIRGCRVIIIRILNSMKKRHRNMKKDQSEIKNAISEINNILEGINMKLDEAED